MRAWQRPRSAAKAESAIGTRLAVLVVFQKGFVANFGDVPRFLVSGKKCGGDADIRQVLM
jgi:hypothetical protein